MTVTTLAKQTETSGQLAPVVTVNSIAKISMRELRELAEVFVASGAFKDVKQLAEAQVKIIAGQEFGFSPIVSMTGIHFFMGKVELSSTLKASLIKSSGKYDYEVTEHTAEICAVQFYRVAGNTRIAMGPPVRYTIADAKAAGIAGKDNWKNHPKDMLFAAVIRQGTRRHCPDVLRGVSSDVDTEIAETVESVPELAATPEGDKFDPTTGEVVSESDTAAAEPPAENDPIEADQLDEIPLQQSAPVEDSLDALRRSIRELLAVKLGDAAEQTAFLKGRRVEQMGAEPLNKLLGDLQAM